jgi:hypothetical protein
MTRHLLLLAVLCLATLRLAAVQIEPDSFYRAVIACDRPASAHDAGWKIFSDNVRNADKGAGLMRIDDKALYLTLPRVRGSDLTQQLGKNFNGLVPRLASAEKLAPSEAELEKARQKLADENDPRRTVDAKGKPIYNAGSPEAEAQLRESAREQDKSAAKFKQYNKWGTNGPVTGEGMTGKPVKNTGAFDEDEPAARPAPAPANKFSKPMTPPAPPRQGTKKDDTLFKNQNQNSPTQFQAPNNFIGIWAWPQDRGTGDNDFRVVLVLLTGNEKPVPMTLKKAKDARYVPQTLRYTSLEVYPE